MSTGWKLVDPPVPVAEDLAVGLATGEWRLVEPDPPVAEDLTVGLASGEWRLVEPDPPVAEDLAVGLASGEWRLVDPDPPVAEDLAVGLTAGALAPAAAPVEMLEDFGGLPVPVADGPTPEQLFGVVQVVARHQGADHRTVEPDPDGEGLRIGIGRFSLAAGAVGRVLRLTEKRDRDAFRTVFGDDANTLLRVANSADRMGRLAPVGDGALWSGSWPSRFRAAAELASGWAAQNEYAIESMCRPLVPVVRALGGADARDLAVAYDRAVAQGTAAAVEWLLATVSPVDPADQERVLAELGYAGWDELRRRVPWLPPTGGGDPLARAALVEASWRSGRVPRPDFRARLVAASMDPAWASTVAGDVTLAAVALEGVPTT